MTEPLVALKSVTKRFRSGTQALEAIDLSVATGEFLSLLGPSGCGKSTLLRLIAGLSQPSSGEVRWSIQPGKTDIGFVFQEPTLMPWASVIDNVCLPLTIAGIPGKEAASRARESLDGVGLTEFADYYPRQLSGGMKMRVSLARALVTSPRILLMDEPFAALDEITRLKLNEELLSLWQTQRFTIIFVTHSVFESVYLSTRIVTMKPHPGRIAREILNPAIYPRGEIYRLSPDYNRVCGDASAALAQAMRQ